jgi:hypothetical protein
LRARSAEVSSGSAASIGSGSLKFIRVNAGLIRAWHRP